MIIHESLIELDVKWESKEEIIRNLARKARELGHISDVEGYIQVVLAREEAYSTAIGYGIALPHGQSQYVQSSFIAFAKSQEGFIWDNETGHEVRLIFLIGISKEETNDLLFKMLAEIGRGLMNTYYREWLVQAMDEEETMAVFREMELLERGRKRNDLQVNSMILLQ